MGIMPELNVIPTSRDVIDNFLGYNHNLRIGNNEFYNMKNLSSDNYPLLSPRGKRRIYKTLGSDITHINGDDRLSYVADGGVYVDTGAGTAKFYDLGLNPKEDNRIVTMGAYLIVYPARKWINTNDGTFGDIDSEYTKTSGSVTVRICTLDEAEELAPPASPTPPEAPENLDYWIDTSNSDQYVLKQWSESTDEWVSISTSYLKILTKHDNINNSDSIAAAFELYDGITISGFNNETLNGDNIVWGKGYGDNKTSYIIISGTIAKNFTEATDDNHIIRFSRKMPDMDFIIEANNRLWGCKYDVEGEMLNEIYASKLGDFKNWRCYQGLASDSYAVSIGHGGFFTGAVNLQGSPVFFKSDRMYTVYNVNPPYQLQEVVCNGPSGNDSDSLAVVDGVLYYKAADGVYRFDGSMPIPISDAFGTTKYFASRGAATNNKYYLSLANNSMFNEWELLVYDIKKGMWHMEDDTKFTNVCQHNGAIYYTDVDKKTIKTIGGNGTSEANPVEWSAETGVMTLEYPDHKYISKLLVRLSLEIGSEVNCYIQYDSHGPWHKVCNIRGVNLKSVSVPIRTRRCDHFRLRLEGKGIAYVYSITKTLEQGSDMR